MTGWQRRHAAIERLLTSGDLDRVQPSGDLDRRLLDEPAANIDTAHAAIDDDQPAHCRSATTPPARRLSRETGLERARPSGHQALTRPGTCGRVSAGPTESR